jgi:cell pole-organizing protein PopZ
MTKDKLSSDPSLDEILASIRQMIANDPPASKEEKPYGISPKQEEREEILDLTNLLSEEPPLSAKDQALFPGEKKADKTEPKVGDKNFEDLLVSPKTASETAQVLDSLSQFVQGRRRIVEPHTPIIENELRDILKPLLQEWLDDHLPSIVRWIVNEQVEKIIQQGGVMVPENKPRKPRDFF